MTTDTAHIPRTTTGWLVPFGENDESAKGQVIGHVIMSALSKSMQAACKLQIDYDIEVDRPALAAQMEDALSNSILSVFDRFGFIRKISSVQMVCPRCFKVEDQQCDPDMSCVFSQNSSSNASTFSAV